MRQTLILLPLKKNYLLTNIEAMFSELNLRNKKWSLCCSFDPHKNLMKEYSKELIEATQFHSKNMTIKCQSGTIVLPTFYKNSLKPSCIDPFLTNNINSFQKTFVSETGLSGFRKLIGTMEKVEKSKKHKDKVTNPETETKHYQI